MAMKTSKHHPDRPELLEKIQVVHLVPKQCLSALQNFPIELILVTGFCGPKQGNRGRKCGARFWSFCSGGDWRTGTLTNDLPGIRDHPGIVFSLFEQFSKPIWAVGIHSACSATFCTKDSGDGQRTLQSHSRKAARDVTVFLPPSRKNRRFRLDQNARVIFGVHELAMFEFKFPKSKM